MQCNEAYCRGIEGTIIHYVITLSLTNEWWRLGSVLLNSYHSSYISKSTIAHVDTMHSRIHDCQSSIHAFDSHGNGMDNGCESEWKEEESILLHRSIFGSEQYKRTPNFCEHHMLKKGIAISCNILGHPLLIMMRDGMKEIHFSI